MRCCAPRRLVLTALAGLLAAGEQAQPPDGRVSLDLLDPLWPMIDGHLPHGVAAARGSLLPAADVEGGGELTLMEGGAFAAVIGHPGPRWTWLAGAAVDARGYDLEEGRDVAVQGLALVGALWYRFSVDDHLVVAAAPSLRWADEIEGDSWLLPSGVLWVHRYANGTLLAAGMATIAASEGVLPIPLVAAVFSPGDWRFVVSPIALSADWQARPDLGMGAFARLTGDTADLPDGDARGDRLLAWDLRVGLRTGWRPVQRWEIAAEAGVAAVRRIGWIRDDETDHVEVDPAPFAGISTSFWW